MAEPTKDPPPSRTRAVGVYDRPASADRFRDLKRWLVLLVLLAVVVVSVLFFTGR
jgi:hypothetical protein